MFSKPITVESCVSEVTKELNSGSWSRTMGHRTSAWCWLLRGQMSISSPILGCGGLHICHLLTNFKLDYLVSRKASRWTGGQVEDW